MRRKGIIMNKIFLDTEFTGLHQNTTLISIGLVSECGKTFYAEFYDYDKSQVDEWIQQNIITNLRFVDETDGEVGHTDAIDAHDFTMTGDTFLVKEYLSVWMAQFGDVEIWSDCLAYDWILFRNIFSNDLPENIYYIPFDLCTLLKVKRIDPDISRELFAFGDDLLDETYKHNALWDAEIIKTCYNKVIEGVQE